MARKLRKQSKSGIYHVMLRGVNGQVIFQEEKDYEDFLNIVDEYKSVSGYRVYGYCLMSNHIHLLIKEEKEEISKVMKKIGIKFVYWYNKKYKRIGPLFQDRFKSEEVESDGYFLTVLRYIHNNPLKAGIEKELRSYRWSSYNEYIEDENICDTSFGLKYFSEDKKEAVKLFKEHHMKANDDKCLDLEEKIVIDDDEAIQIIKTIASIDKIDEVRNFENVNKEKIIKYMKTQGCSIRQIERVTGISFAFIRRV